MDVVVGVNTRLVATGVWNSEEPIFLLPRSVPNLNKGNSGQVSLCLSLLLCQMGMILITCLLRLYWKTY